MTKTKVNYELDYRLALIEEEGFSLELPANFSAVPGFNFQVGLEATLNPDEKKIVVSNRIEIRSTESEPLLAYIAVRYLFELKGIETLPVNTAGTPVLPVAVQTSINAVALSTSRGILFSKFKGTPLHQAILPLINAGDFADSET